MAQIVGLAAGHHRIGAARADHDLLVHPRAARITNVGLEAGPRRDRPATYPVRLDDGPRAVADHGHRLARIEERLHEVDGRRLHPQKVRVGDAAGQHQGVVLRVLNVAHRPVRLEGVGGGQVVERLYLADFGRDQLGCTAGLLHRRPGFGELDLLHALRCYQERDSLAVEFSSHQCLRWGSLV